MYLSPQVCPVSWAIILVSPRTLQAHSCHRFTAMPDTSSSLTLNAETCPSGMCLTSLSDWELSASSQEKNIKLSAFISTCLLTSDGSFEVERLMYSMYTVGTQTSNLLAEHQRRVTTTQSRMVTSWLAASNGLRAESDLARILISGLRLRMQRIERHFGAWSRSWILSLCVAHSASCRNTPIGSTPRLLPCMSHPEDLRLLEEMLTDEIRGYRQLVSDWDNHR